MIRSDILNLATSRILIFLREALTRNLESVRIGRAIQALLHVGIGIDNRIFHDAMDLLSKRQNVDGGWSDPEETAWVNGCISRMTGQWYSAEQSAIKWLNSVRQNSGGWGHHSRDQARIPITALISTLVPDAFEEEDLSWLQGEWEKDFNGPVRLSYKAGFYLLAMPLNKRDELLVKTISHIARDQNDNGGFGPWRDHPIGSDPWSTGVVLWGLSKWVDLAEPTVFEKALKWLNITQLSSGYWPYHYLDDGTSIALIGAVSAMKALAGAET